MADELPYRAEYAKSGRSSCKNCRKPIEQNSLRLAVLVKSAKFDGKMTSWYHLDCFFERQRPKSEADIAHFESLRWEDQEKIRTRLAGVGSSTPANGRKRKGGKVANGDYSVEYAKSNRSTCRTCNEKIEKDAVRISKKSYESERAKMYGPQDEWHHMDCFQKNRDELGFSDSADNLPGFNTLSAEDKATLRKILPAKSKTAVKAEPADSTDSGPSSAKKNKTSESAEEVDKELMKKQNQLIFKYRDALEKNLNKKELEGLLEYNKQGVPSGISSMLDRLADNMAFGALNPCPECKEGQLVYRSGAGYQCTGNMSEWTKCTYATKDPDRKRFKIPPEMATEYPFLKDYKFVPGKRYVPHVPPKKEIAAPLPTGATSKRVATGPPLSGMSFVMGSSLKSNDGLRKKIEDLGGKVSSRMSAKVAALVATKEELNKGGSKFDKAQELGIQVVPENFVEQVETNKERSPGAIISNMNMAPWGTNVEKRVGLEKNEPKTGIKYSKSVPEKLKLKLKGGGVVDPESGLEEKAHVLKVGDQLYSVVLGVVDIQNDRNSYYKLQILQHDKKAKWYLFRSWGRIGTSIGDNKLESFDDKEDAIRSFVALYEEKTGNPWKNHKNFVKQPGKLYPLDIDYGEAAEESKMSSAGSKSKLPKSVQDLVCMIFDVEAMKRAMVEFELDLTKMPLGKISRKQIEKAYAVLNEVEQLLHQAAQASQAKFVDASNRFYTLIPHDFGMKTPPLLNNEELVKMKLEMLESLLEIEVAYSLLKAGDEVKDKDPIDAHYEKLKAKIEVVDNKSDEFKLIHDYVKNTHAPTHTQYSLELEEVFKVDRQGESSRYRPFSKLHNRKLLWHGSRVSNFAGIVSQGLRIAPPEAPVTGYMFGKGIYFADMVTKSANYCATSRSNPQGLMLLCEVALGEMYERKEADYIEKLPKGKHSVKGLGQTEPDPDQKKVLDGGLEVPLGKPVETKIKKSSLLYNEYIVYDVAQVRVKYLCKMKFNYRR